ncbi:MAG: LPS export ABC transporter permease LptG [Deltaproteobacteria bacterium]
MKIIDRYISKDFLKYFFSSITVFALLYFLVDLLQRSIKDGLTLALIQFTLLQLPHIVSQMIPVACMIGSLFVLNTLSKNSELIAMHACGISLQRISAVILILSTLIGIGNFFVVDLMVPPTLEKARYIFNREVRGDLAYQIFKTQGIWYRSKNAIYNIAAYNPDENLIAGVYIYLLDDQFKLVEQIIAQKAYYNKSKWTIEDGISITFLEDFPISHTFQTKTADYITEKPEDFKETTSLETLSFHDLAEYIEKHKKAGFNTVRHQVNLHAKISYALACLIMAFLGIPFSARHPKAGGVALSSSTALGIAFFYWICLNASLSFGYSGALPPIIAAWTPNILFAIISFYLLDRRQKLKPLWPYSK